MPKAKRKQLPDSPKKGELIVLNRDSNRKTVEAQQVIGEDGVLEDEKVEVNPDDLPIQQRLKYLEECLRIKNRQYVSMENSQKSLKKDMKSINEKIFECMQELKLPIVQETFKWTNGYYSEAAREQVKS